MRKAYPHAKKTENACTQKSLVQCHIRQVAFQESQGPLSTTIQIQILSLLKTSGKDSKQSDQKKKKKKDSKQQNPKQKNMRLNF